MRRKLKRPFVVCFFIFFVWILIAQGCMKFRISDAEAKREFNDAGIALKTGIKIIHGFPLHYAQTGNDSLPTLLFIHGTPGSWDGFKNYLKNTELLKHFRIISIDRPGFGYSDFGNAMNLTDQTAIITSWMDSMNNHHPFIIIGHSLGGPLTVKIAAARMQDCKAIIILAGSLDPAAESPEKWRPILFKSPLNYLVPGALRPCNEELWYLKTDLKQMREDYAKITCPVYILHGNKDMLVPYTNVAYAKKMFSSSPNVLVTTFENENHFIVWTREKEIVKLLLQLF